MLRTGLAGAKQSRDIPRERVFPLDAKAPLGLMLTWMGMRVNLRGFSLVCILFPSSPPSFVLSFFTIFTLTSFFLWIGSVGLVGFG